MRVIAQSLFILLIAVVAGLACGAEEAEPTPGSTPTEIANVQGTSEPQPETSTPMSPEPTSEPTSAPPTGQPATPRASAPSPTVAPEPTDAPEDTPAPDNTPTPADTPTPAITEAPEETPAENGAEPDSFLVGEGSQITFTVEEETNFAPVRFDAVISGSGLSGYANLDGSPSEIVLDLHSLESDQSFRDRYIRDRMFPSTPTAIVVVESLPDLSQGLLRRGGNVRHAGGLPADRRNGLLPSPSTCWPATTAASSTCWGRQPSLGTNWDWASRSSAP